MASLMESAELLAREIRRRQENISSQTREGGRFHLDNIHPNGFGLLEGIDINDDRPIARILNACLYSENFEEERDPVENPAEFDLVPAEEHAVDQLGRLYNKNQPLRDIIRFLIMTRCNLDFKLKGVYFKVAIINSLPYLLMLDPLANQPEDKTAHQEFQQTVSTRRDADRSEPENSEIAERSQIATRILDKRDVRSKEASYHY